MASASLDHEAIDEINILEATMKVMTECITAVSTKVLDKMEGTTHNDLYGIIDGIRIPPNLLLVQRFKGDACATLSPGIYRGQGLARSSMKI